MADYADAYRWSIDNPAQFWAEVARFADVRASCAKEGPVIENPGAMPGARFFPSARLNFAENLLRYRDAHPALVFRNERGTRCELSYRQLYAEVARIAAGLQAAGVVAGDRVAAFMPNLPETAVAMLATASLGAIWSSCSPDFGLEAVVDRFGQIEPKVLFATDGYFYAGKTLDSLPLVGQLLQRLPSCAGAHPHALRKLRRRARAHSCRQRKDCTLAGIWQCRFCVAIPAASVQSPALHHVFLGHHRRAEVHRSRRGRHTAAASKGASPAHRCAPRGSHFLFHHLRMDDVELADERSCNRRHAPAL